MQFMWRTHKCISIIEIIVNQNCDNIKPVLADELSEFHITTSALLWSAVGIIMISKFLEIKVLLSVMRIDSYVINGILDLL